MGARYEHHCTSSSSSSTRRTSGRDHSIHRCANQYGGIWQFSASSGQSSCRLGIFVELKRQRLANIVGDRKPEFNRQKSLTANWPVRVTREYNAHRCSANAQDFLCHHPCDGRTQWFGSCLTGSRVECWIDNGAGFYWCNHFGSDERPRRYLERGSNADGPNGRSGRHDLSRPTNRSCGKGFAVSAGKLVAIARRHI